MGVSRISMQVMTWEPRKETGGAWRATPFFESFDDPNEVMGFGIDAPSAVADCRTNVARALEIDPTQIHFFAEGRHDKKAVRKEAQRLLQAGGLAR